MKKVLLFEQGQHEVSGRHKLAKHKQNSKITNAVPTYITRNSRVVVSD